MEKLIELLTNLKSKLEVATSSEDISDAINKIKLYINTYFKENKTEYLKLLDEVSTSSYGVSFLAKSLISIITTMLEDIELSKEKFTILTQEEKDEFKNLTRIYEERKNILEVEAAKIQQLNKTVSNQQKTLSEYEQKLLSDLENLSEKEKLFEEERNKRQESLLEQEKVLNIFKAKLQLADKNIDFQNVASKNRTIAYYWAYIAAFLIVILFIILGINLTKSTSLVLITNTIKSGIIVTKNSTVDITPVALYIGYAKYIISKLLIYSMLIYAIVFCVKNYNAQMHNFVVNTQKSNSFKSTLSLLDTARTDEGNDKLLIQATQAIFSHQQSGYSGKDSEPNNPNLITNMIDTAASKI